MRLSQNMKESLLFIKQCTGPNTSCGRPTHYLNLLTHNALIRRGLIEEANDSFHTITLTVDGEYVVSSLEIKKGYI